MESPGKQKKRKTKKHLEKRSIARGTEDRKDLGRNEDGCKRQEEMESSSDRPMSPLGRSGLKKNVTNFELQEKKLSISKRGI